MIGKYDKHGNPLELDFSEESIVKRSFKSYYNDEGELEERIETDDLNEEKDKDEEEFKLDLDDEKDEDEDEEEIEDEKDDEDDCDESMVDEIAFALEESTLNEKERTRMDRKKLRGKKDALKLITKGQFSKWDLRKKAMFVAKFQYMEISPGKGRYIKRKKPKNVQDVFKLMKKKAKVLKKTMRSKGSAIAKKIQRIKARGK